jgi:hypothetical protein
MPIPDNTWWVAHDHFMFPHPYNPQYTELWDGDAQIAEVLGMVNLPATDYGYYATDGKKIMRVDPPALDGAGHS